MLKATAAALLLAAAAAKSVRIDGTDSAPPAPYAAAVSSTSDYYAGITEGPGLKDQLSKLIFNHTHLSYNAIWGEFSVLETHMPECAGHGNNSIADIYSSKCWNASEKCGNYKKEGDCFNR